MCVCVDERRPLHTCYIFLRRRCSRRHAIYLLSAPPTALRRCGIFVRDEQALLVGNQPVGEGWGDWVCPHIVGGLPPSVVEAVLPMERTPSGSFVHRADASFHPTRCALTVLSRSRRG